MTVDITRPPQNGTLWGSWGLTMDAAVREVQGTTGARVFNQQTNQWEVWPIYYSATDPAASAAPPVGNYVWQQLLA